MICASALSTTRNTDGAFAEILDRVSATFAKVSPGIAVAFVSAHHADSLDRLAGAFRERHPGTHFLGVTGETIVGDGREVEGATAASLWAIELPQGVTAEPVRMTWDQGRFEGIPERTESDDAEGSGTLLLFGDPFSFPTDRLLKTLEGPFPGMPVVGGMASGANAPGGNRLALEGEIYEDGAVGLRLRGPLTIRTVVSQGCRPVGRSMVITRAERNVIKELGRRPALEVLRETFTSLNEEDQRLIREGLHVGRVINEYQESFGRGDFLIRNVMGSDDEGGIAISDDVRVGQTVQFHVRDASTADEDLRTMLEQNLARPSGTKIAGGLLFSCNGRGTRLFPEPDHDASAIGNALGPVPLAGFFAMGELGPIGGKNFVHGFTASLAIFETPEA